MCDIKSSAVVKYSATKSPARYNELATNTNINSPPADWLRGRFATKEPWAPGQGSQRGKEFSSFAMANSFIDHVGKVDVITDAENVKKLLKMNFSKAPVSMMVHRVGRTLLIDNLDVYKHVLLSQEQDWKWLRQFIYENLLPPNVDSALIPASGGGALRRKDIEENLMLSKFLYHSLESVRENDVKYDDARREKNYPNVVPDPLVSEADNFEAQSNFERNILWNFEDIRMLIGTDMPIFGGGTHPCVSLRLRDMKKPINVLTGIDYWLDQLMCTVPEVVMCYHLNGIVQRYEVVRTEDLPSLPDSSFSPELIRDVAQNILSFLKSNATKEGHTYWLFKGKDDDIVKLYDLTSVCKEYVKEKDANPFTLPVAVLLYRVAKNLLQKTATSNPRKMSSTIYRLLTHCLELMDAEKFPQVIGSVHYLLANLYITCGKPSELDDKKDVNESNEKEKEILEEFDDSFDQNDWYIEDPSKKTKDFQNTKTDDGVSSVSLDLLAGPAEIRNDFDAQTSPSSSANQNLNKWKFIPNCTNLEDCWQAALEHVLKGFECVKAFSVESNSTSGEKVVDAQVTAVPDEAIPLQYEPLRPTDYKAKVLPLAVRFPNATGWRLELTSLLLVKAVSAYHLLADCACKLQNYGKALRYIKLGFLCYESSKKLIDSSVGCRSATINQCDVTAQKLLPSMLVLCGDIHLVLSHQKATLMGKHIRDYNSQMYRDERIAAQAKLVLGEDAELEFSWCASLSESIEQNLHLSTKCYEQACALIRGSANALENNKRILSNPSSKTQSSSGVDGEDEFDYSMIVLDTLMISKRLGNVKNELGVYYMNLSSALLSKEEDPDAALKKAESCWHMSYGCFQEGIQIFNKINDKSNESLLNSNAGRLMRLCANAYGDSGKEFSDEEQHYLLRAIELYQRALECVNQRSDNNHIWEAIAWELSTVYFTHATQLQDRPPLSLRTADELEKEIVDLMQKSLRLVDSLDHQDLPKHAVYVYRASIIHHKLAAMYHRSYLKKERMSDRKVKQIRSLTDMHYQKASDGYKEIVTECPTDYVRVQLERVALLENSLEAVTSANSKLKLCQQALHLIFSCRTAFVGLCRKLSEKESTVGTFDDDVGIQNDDVGVDEETLNTDVTTTKLDRKKKADEALVKECQTLCTLTIQRVQFLLKQGLMLIRTASIKDANQDLWKDAYATTLHTMPTNVIRLPSFVLNVLEKLNKMSLH